MQGPKSKVLILSSQSEANASLVECLRTNAEVVEIASIEEAIDALRHSRFDAIFSDSADFLPLERALVSQQASLILNTLGEGVCIVDGEGRCNWMNRKMQAWPARVHERIRRTCLEAFELFSRQYSPPPPSPAAAAANGGAAAAATAAAAGPGVGIGAGGRSKRYSLNVEEQGLYFEMMASPVVNPAGQVVQVVAVIWDATATRRLQQKIDAIDGAGSELCRLEADLITTMDVGARLKLLEEKIIRYTRDLLHFDHFAIRLLDRKNNDKLELVIAVGLPPEATEVELRASVEGNGISGYVAATGRSYICPDVERDPRYVTGLDHARSTLTVPLLLHDKVIGIFNIESRQKAAFNEDDRQFAEIFGRYVAIALNVLDLLRVERVDTAHKVADDVCTEVAAPLNDIVWNARTLIEEYIGNDELRRKLEQIVDHAEAVRKSLHQAAEGPNKVLGAGDVKGAEDPLIGGRDVLVADDEPNIRTTISEILRKFRAKVTVAESGLAAIARLEQQDFDLVISDISMPDKTGYDVFAAARRKKKRTPVILMTGFGYDPSHSIFRASQEGLQAVLFKPFKVDKLLDEVRNALRNPDPHPDPQPAPAPDACPSDQGAAAAPP